MTRSLLALPFLVAGCAQLSGADSAPGGGAATAPATSPIRQGPSASADAFDTVSEQEKAEARASAAAGGGSELGKETVSLGDPGDPGLWVKSRLVTEEAKGTVRTGDGEAISVTLRPLGGAGGAQISLAAARALNLPLAGLSTVTLARSG